MKTVISSILDTDLYKLTMQQAVLRLYPKTYAKYQFINRGLTEFPEGFGRLLQKQVDGMRDVALTKDEKEFLIEKCPYLTQAYLNFLSNYRFDPAEVVIVQDEKDLKVSVEGIWCRTILWEVPLMALISELYFKTNYSSQSVYSLEERRRINLAKANLFNKEGVIVLEFGTRRRHSLENHRQVAGQLKKTGNNFIGTSNVFLAKELDLIPRGTTAHEWTQPHGVMFGYKDANLMAMKRWREVYGDDLAIALTDTFGSQAFFNNFDQTLANQFAGIRQDSGDPFIFLENAIEHYEKLGIDPSKKAIVFSDSLTPELAVAIHKACNGRVLDSYGIGTNLTNDVGVKPLNIVIKMVAFKTDRNYFWVPTVKLSDVAGKHTGEREEIKKCKRELGVKIT